jgi:hypothetical protein
MLSQYKTAVHQQLAKLLMAVSNSFACVLWLPLPLSGQRGVIYKSNGGISKGIGNLNSAFEKADRLLEQKLTDSQFH